MDLLQQNYEKIRTVGKGAFGTAVLYRKRQNNKLVVLKEININDLSEIEKEMALNEVEILSSLSHPNIIGYGGSFEINGALMIEMEYADGGTLAQMLSHQDHNLPERQILNLFQQISSGIIHMHENNILHRDLKTANVFLNSDGFVKIGDFGISKILTTHAQAQTVLGTPYYISPEMCEGKAYDEKSDIWAMGCILYEMCCLQRTFQASSLPALVNKIMKGNVKPIPDGYSIKLKKLVRTLLDKNPENRPSAREVHDVWIPDISQFLENKGFVYIERKINKKNNNLTVIDNKTERTVLYDLRYLENDIKIEPVKLPVKLKMKQVSVGLNHTLLTSEDCFAYSWGCNNKGQLGLRFISKCESTPKIINNFKSMRISKIVVGVDFSLFLDENGVVYSCGNGSNGCLGHGDWDDCNYPREIISLSSMTLVDLICGSNHVIALSDQYEIFVWGGNEKGQLGTRNYKTLNMPTLINTSAISVHYIFCGFDTNIFSDVSGTKIWACGSNENNKLAVGSPVFRNNYNYLLQIKNIKGCLEYCSIGINHCIYVVKLKKGKAFYLSGRYFDDDQTQISRLIEVDQFKIKNIVNVKCGPTYSVFQTKENVVMAWGLLEHENYKTVNEFDKKSNQSSGIWSQSSEEQNIDFSGFHKSKKKLSDPTTILALYSSERQINLGNILKLENIYPSKSNILILCKTSAGFITRNKPESQNKEMPIEQLPKWVNDEIAISKYPWNI